MRPPASACRRPGPRSASPRTSGAARSARRRRRTCTWPAARSSWRHRSPWSPVAAAPVPTRLLDTRSLAAAPASGHTSPVALEVVSTAASLLSLAAMAPDHGALLGSRDPLANPSPVVWTVWWIGFTYLHAVFGNLWAHVNPWIGLDELPTAAGLLRHRRERPPLRVPGLGRPLAGGGRLPRVRLVRVIHPAPSHLAAPAALASYCLFQLAGVPPSAERSCSRRSRSRCSSARAVPRSRRGCGAVALSADRHRAPAPKRGP